MAEYPQPPTHIITNRRDSAPSPRGIRQNSGSLVLMDSQAYTGAHHRVFNARQRRDVDDEPTVAALPGFEAKKRPEPVARDRWAPLECHGVQGSNLRRPTVSRFCRRLPRTEFMAYATAATDHSNRPTGRDVDLNFSFIFNLPPQLPRERVPAATAARRSQNATSSASSSCFISQTISSHAFGSVSPTAVNAWGSDL